MAYIKKTETARIGNKMMKNEPAFTDGVMFSFLASRKFSDEFSKN